MVVDLDAFDANADDLVRRAGGTPIRVASKSVRVPALLSRVLARDGFQGVLAYTLAEALWLEEQGISDDVVVAYPTVDRGALARLVASPSAAGRITLMVDDVAHLDVVDSVRASQAVQVRVAIDVDAGLRMGRQHVGPKRSPLYDADDVVALARRDRAAARVPAGRRDDLRGPGRRRTGRGADPARPLRRRTPDQVAVAGPAGGPPPRGRRRAARGRGRAGVLERRRLRLGARRRPTRWSPRWRPGSGLLAPTLFDHYQSFDPRPAAFFGLPVTRRPSPQIATVHGGGLVASGPAGKDRLPDAVGAGRAAPDRARGRRRGADAAHRPPGRAAGDRRPGLVPPRQVRRAVRAHQHRAAARPAPGSSRRSATYRGHGLAF